MIRIIILVSIVLVFSKTSFSQNVGINNSGANPDGSAMLDVNSTDKGVLIPRVSLTGTNDLTTISSPATSLLVFNTSTVTGVNGVFPSYYYFDGTKWVFLRTSNMASDSTHDFWLDSMYIRNGDTIMMIKDNGNVGIGTASPNYPLHIYSQETVAKIESFGPGGTEAALLLDAPNAANNGGAELAYRRRGTDQIFTGILKFGDGAYSVSRNNSALPGGALSRIDTNGTYTLHHYGNGNKEASDLSATQSNYLAAYSTNGVLTEMNMDTLKNAISDSSEWVDMGPYILARKAAASGDTVMILDNGKMGVDINPTTSWHKLTVGGYVATSTGGVSLGINGATNVGELIVNNADASNTPTPGVAGIAFKTSYTTRMTILGNTGNGNVGIGETIPQKKLHVNAGNDSLQIDNLAGIGTVLGIDANGKVFKTNGASSEPWFSITTGTGATLNTENIYQMGNVGIGTTPTTNVLTVSDDALIDGITVGQGPGNFTTNTVVGNFALQSNTTGSFNLALGYGALSSNTTGTSNTAVGSESMLSNTTGEQNTGTGYGSLGSNISGNGNVANGDLSLYSNSTGNFNTALGGTSMYSNTSGGNTTAIGFNSLYSNTVGSDNVALGYEALYSNISGSENLAIGNNTLYSNISGQRNIAIGLYAGDLISTGSNNIVIGHDIDAPLDAGNNQLTIGNLIFANGIDGTSKTISSGNVGVGVSNPSEKLEVVGTIKATDINFTGLATYADDTAAGLGGLVTGDVYKTAAGDLKIKL